MTTRFIAGATCPKCGAVDRIVVDNEPQHRVRRCVECDFREALTTQSMARDFTDNAAALAAVRIVTSSGGVGDITRG